MKRSREADLLGKLDDLMAELGEEERVRALDWLRAKYVPNAQLPRINKVTRKLEPPWVSEVRGQMLPSPPFCSLVFC